jgi:hypothetical protein
MILNPLNEIVSSIQESKRECQEMAFALKSILSMINDEEVAADGIDGIVDYINDRIDNDLEAVIEKYTR